MLQGNLLSGVSEGSEYRTGDGIPYGQYTDGYRGVKVATLKPQTALGSGSGCQILLKNQNKIVLNQTEWTEVLQNVLRRKGYNSNAADEIVEVTIQ